MDILLALQIPHGMFLVRLARRRNLMVGNNDEVVIQKHLRFRDVAFYKEIEETIIFNDLEEGEFTQLVRILLRREIKRMKQARNGEPVLHSNHVTRAH
jgi:hypothetical protein